MKFSIKDLFSKCDQIRSFLRIWSHLLKKSLMENFIFCAVIGFRFADKSSNCPNIKGWSVIRYKITDSYFVRLLFRIVCKVSPEDILSSLICKKEL